LGLGVLHSQAEAMKVQFGFCCFKRSKIKCIHYYSGLNGMPAKEISVKNLANIIHGRMG
jgi:cell division protein FtsA